LVRGARQDWETMHEPIGFDIEGAEALIAKAEGKYPLSIRMESIERPRKCEGCGSQDVPGDSLNRFCHDCWEAGESGQTYRVMTPEEVRERSLRGPQIHIEEEDVK
jgi:hypothetical protein